MNKDMNLRIATWNLDRPTIRKTYRADKQKDLLKLINADILILTETDASFCPPDLPYSAVPEGDPEYHKRSEVYAAIWSRYPMHQIQTVPDNRYFTVCAEIRDHPTCGNIIVYGAIMTYKMDGVREKKAKPWEMHLNAVRSQTAEWARLRERYPHHMMIVAGDFNESLNGQNWYGIQIAKDTIHNALVSNGMECLTSADVIKTFNENIPLSRTTVNHICITASQTNHKDVWGWEGTVSNAVLSDHNGVFVDIKYSVLTSESQSNHQSEVL